MRPLPVRRHNITLITPSRIPGMTLSYLNQLLDVDPLSWSAVTIEASDGRMAIIYNPEHSPARQESDLAHEVAHLLCKHKPTELVRMDGLPFPLRTFDPDQEEEANWLCGCLKLPRPALIWALRRGMTDADIVDYFGVSLELAIYRKNITGVHRQLSAARRRRYTR